MNQQEIVRKGWAATGIKAWYGLHLKVKGSFEDGCSVYAET